MINTNISAVYGSLTGLRKLIDQNIQSTFTTFLPLEDRAQSQDTFTRSTQE